jgi:hypothetical protein
LQAEQILALTATGIEHALRGGLDQRKPLKHPRRDFAAQELRVRTASGLQKSAPHRRNRNGRRLTRVIGMIGHR